MTDLSGRCLCGAVRFTVTDADGAFGVCHCKMCQRWTGFAFAGLTVPPDRLAVSGSAHVGRWRSSDVSERAFCTRCGSSLWFVDLGPDGAPQSYDICIGLLDRTDDLVLDREIFIDRKAGGWAIAGAHPRVTEADWFARKGFIPIPTETGQ